MSKLQYIHQLLQYMYPNCNLYVQNSKYFYPNAASSIPFIYNITQFDIYFVASTLCKRP